jgi:hypothetical protein
MSAVTRFLDWLDEAAGGAIRLAYLLAGITAVAVYFGAGHLPMILEGALNAALPWALAFAIETHTYISARRVRLAWQDRQASTHDAPEWSRASDAMRVNLAILGVLLAFSAWNQLNYLYETWTPQATTLALPAWAAYVVRALVVPAAFMAAAFLAPSAAPVAAHVFSIARKQRRKLIRQAEADGRDMTGALVELVEDPAARRIIAHAYGAIKAPMIDAPYAGPLLTSSGTPAQTAPEERIIEAPEVTPPARLRAVSAPRRRGVRRGARQTASVEAKARAAYQPGMSIADLERAAKISRGSAMKWRSTLRAEAEAQAQGEATEWAV